MHGKPILVFGATGRQGGAVARHLLGAGRAVRAIVRDRSNHQALELARIGAEIAQGSFSDTAAISDAMAGVEGVFSVLPGTLAAEDEVRFGCNIADLAVEAKVSHFVYSSGASVGPIPTGVPRMDAKPKIEAHVRSLSLAVTIIRPMIFMEMMVRSGGGLEEGRLISIMEPDLPVQVIALEDIGRFVTAIFADRARFVGKTLKLASDTISGREMAALMSNIAGQPIRYEQLPDAVLAANRDLAAMAKSQIDGPLSEHADLDLLRQINPAMTSFQQWLMTDGQSALRQALL